MIQRFTRRSRVGAAMLGSLAVAGLALSQAAPVHADPAPQAHDVVGVGSDIIQSSIDFLADGYNDGTTWFPGYNSAGNSYRVVNFDATADANGRNAFIDPTLYPADGQVQGTTGTGRFVPNTPASTLLNPSVVLRAGTSPVQRPNGGGAGITAFLNDGNASANNLIQFVRTPNPVTQTQLNAGNVTDKVETVQFAQDEQYIATATAGTTNAPPEGLTAADLKKIYNGTYKTWGDVKDGDAATNATAAHTSWTPSDSVKAQTIVAEIPQDGAGVQKVFLAAIGLSSYDKASGTIVRQVQQNDPTTITGLSDADKANAIVPFPKGRFTLLGKGYFHNPNTPYNANSPAATLTTAGIQLQVPGASSVAASSYTAHIPYYVLVRKADLESTTAWQPGSTLNWAETFFAQDPNRAGAPDNPPAPFVNSAAGKAIIQALGLTPTYAVHLDNWLG